MPAVANTASAFAITELSGQERAVVLVDRALPYRPFELVTKQRVELTWYPGNPEATATVLGAQEDPTNINGQWKDKYISNAVPVTTDGVAGPISNQLTPVSVDGERVNSVREAVALFDSIVREGQLLEVTWDNQTRHGMLTEFRKRWQNTHDLEWEMSFVWISRGEPTQPAVLTTEDAVGSSADLTQQQNRRLQNNAAFRFAVSSARQSQLIAALSTVNAAVLAATSTNTSLNQQASSPQDAARRMTALCNSVQSSAEALVAVLEATPWFAINATVALAELTYGERIDAYSYVRALIDDAEALARTAVEYKAALLAQASTDLLGIYTAREGDDLRGVSEQFYGTPFEWQRLLTYNSLLDAALEPGTLVLVPRVARQDRRV